MRNGRVSNRCCRAPWHWRRPRCRRPVDRGRGPVGGAHRGVLARSALGVPSRDQRVPAFCPLERRGRLGPRTRRNGACPGQHAPRGDRQHDRARPSACGRGEKKGGASQTLEHSSGGLSTKILAFTKHIDGLVRLHLTAGQWAAPSSADSSGFCNVAARSSKYAELM